MVKDGDGLVLESNLATLPDTTTDNYPQKFCHLLGKENGLTEYIVFQEYSLVDLMLIADPVRQEEFLQVLYLSRPWS